MDEQKLRDQMNQYIETNGIKAVWVAQQLNIDAPLLSRWRKGKRDMWECTLKDVENFLAIHY